MTDAGIILSRRAGRTSGALVSAIQIDCHRGVFGQRVDCADENGAGKHSDDLTRSQKAFDHFGSDRPRRGCALVYGCPPH